MKKACSTCHTIHNSEDSFVKVSGGPLDALMTATCAACHTGTNGDFDKPFVNSIASPAYGPGAGGTLAGGSFYWVVGVSDLKGHNVVGVGATQVSGREPPGGSPLKFDTLTCAGENGCHGDRSVAGQVRSIWGSHHSPEESLSTDGSSIARSYRFLDGISGVEDSNWEYTLSTIDHNQYKGDARNSDIDLATSTSISHLCAKCHGAFHSGANPSFATPWLRHPVDFDMGEAAGSEYAAYGDGGAGIYNVRTPLASTSIPDLTPGFVDLGGTDNDAIITCITCHRAHGSPYDYSLRWDYRRWPGGDDNGGCYDCHTVKN